MASDARGTHYKQELEAVSKECVQLRNEFRLLQVENQKLKAALYDVSMRLQEATQGKPPPPVDINRVYASFQSEAPAQKLLDDRSGGKPEKQFAFSFDIQIHEGAVYCAQFSHDGGLLASGGFDKKVGVWDVAASKTVHVLAAHTSSISDLSWSADATNVISASLDSSAVVWDIASGSQISTHSVRSFGLAVRHHPLDPHLFFMSDSQKAVYLFDRRQPRPGVVVTNDASVNCLEMERLGTYFVSGDAKGQVKLWDIRALSVVVPGEKSTEPGSFVFHSFINGQEGIPISNIHSTYFAEGSVDNHRFLAVNSYDNVLRVYDRGSTILNTDRPSYRLREQLYGLKNKNFPIKSSFYTGKNYNPKVQVQEEGKEETPDDRESAAKGLDESMLLATGSCDSLAYVYDLSNEGGSLLQKLSGHKDIVFGIHCHPTDPILASYSADGLIKIWAPKSIKKSGKQ
eukprot:TRINITY_DN3019_c0_g1_i1.p1 TRINITY_DN3019_c0_g1~~TRINITY_DN3019_c0_g1_i1.p1  ORF type:complete len:467 (-),score=74.63 TRINITY_DN3019_c0_g1_i1:7-1380(-)